MTLPPPPTPQPLTLRTAGPLTGTVAVPGDKSISHRALMFGALAVGETVIDGLLEGEDVHATAGALRAMGAEIVREESGRWRVWGVGVGGLLQPATALDMGNSGTSTRLLMGLVASHPLTATFVGDASLSARPMGRVTVPLGLMGASFATAPGGRLPLTMTGRCPAVPLRYVLPVASAQVKSAVLLAGLNTPGRTVVVEREPTRDHSERMLRGFGAEVTVEATAEGRAIGVMGEAELRPQAITVPGDISSAAFLDRRGADRAGQPRDADRRRGQPDPRRAAPRAGDDGGRCRPDERTRGRRRAGRRSDRRRVGPDAASTCRPTSRRA